MGWAAAVGKRGGLILPPDVPPGGAAYGPTNGPQAVRDGTAPLAVTHPGGSPTVVNPGDNIATKITTAGAGGTLWFTKGTHTVSETLTPLANQRWFLESAAGYTRSATDSAVMSASGMFNFLVRALIGGVEIRGGLWQNHQNDVSSDAFASCISSGEPTALPIWLVEDAIITNNTNIGLSNCSARRCYVHHNGRYGITHGPDNTVIEKCRVSFNNTRNLDWGFDAGGTKLAAGGRKGHTFRECWVHDNTGMGIWYDGTQGDHLITENVCENNLSSGIYYELSWGGTTISRNYLNDNAELAPDVPANTGLNTLGSWNFGLQLIISTSDGTDNNKDIIITLNDIDSNERAMGMLNMQGRLNDPCRRVKFRSNRVWLRNTGTFGGEQGQVGGIDTQTVHTMFTETSNEFSGNEYRVASSTHTYWKWGGAGVGANINWNTWLAQGLNRGNAVDTRVLI